MKKIIASAVICFSIQLTNAQESYFNTGNFQKDVPGLVLTKSGELKEVSITYDHPDFIKSSSYPLKTSQGEIHKSTLEAFYIDGKTWVFRETAIGPFWVVLERQGAIEVYTTVQSDSKGKLQSSSGNTILIVTGGAVEKGSNRILQSEMMFTYKKRFTEMVKDHQELAAKIGTKGYGALQYLNAVDEYNDWYENNHPGTIKYLPANFVVRIPGISVASKSFTGLADMKEQLKTDKETLNAERTKKLDDLFGNRTSTVSAELASAKDNVPVKKETFAAKLDRIKADGNKVGVILYLQPARVNPPEASGDVIGANLIDFVKVTGEYMDESLKASANEFVEELNQALNVSNFELIDINTIPYRETKFGRLDDWWASKYKVVFAYSLDPRIRASNEETGGKTKFTASLNMIQSLVVREYIGGPGASKQDIITQVLNMGSFVTPTYAQDDQMTDVKAIYDKTLEKLAVPILSKIREERADGVKKLVEKKLKP